MMKVLYLAAGNPIHPGVGMDHVVRQHVKELSESSGIDVTAIAVAPGIPGQGSPGFYQVGKLPVQLYVGDLLSEQAGLQRWVSKLKFIFCHSVPVMAYSFKCEMAASHIRKALRAKDFDLVVLDHYYALSNIDLSDIAQARTKLIYISHDAMFPHIGEMAQVKRTILAKAYYFYEAVRAHWVERKIFKMASKVIHLSEYERSSLARNSSKHFALLPPVHANPEDVGESPVFDFSRSVVFIGSPSHPPNAHALNWIVERFAPALMRRDPSIQIALIGGGTERFTGAVSNIQGLGFVSAGVVQSALKQCICSISPVVLGRGIKVKVLDALAAGCPVLATEQSLRGFELFGLSPAFNLGDPEALVGQIYDLLEPARQRGARMRVAQLWAEFVSQRRGRLADLIRSEGQLVVNDDNRHP